MKRTIAALFLMIGLFMGLSITASARDDEGGGFGYGLSGTREELALYSLVFSGRYIDAREAAEALLKKDPDSYIGQLAMGQIHYYGEANFPKALRHVREARRLYEARHPTYDPDTVRWHAQILNELSWAHYSLGQHAERLERMEELKRLYGIDRGAETAWSLMKLGELERARAAVQAALDRNDPQLEEIALNSLCAIEFEAGEDERSYAACKEAVEARRRRGAMPLLVDLTNFAEAARGLFRFEESERALLEAARMREPSYGNPHRELADLYLRQGRFVEAASAVRAIPETRLLRPASMIDSDRAEIMRTMASLFLLAGEPATALEMTRDALRRPDRRAHQSRDPAQDLAVVSLLDRAARLAHAEMILEEASTKNIFYRAGAYIRSGYERLLAYRSGRRALSALSGEDRLIGFFRVDSAKASIVAPWFVGDLIKLIGPGISRALLDEAGERDQREQLGVYLDAFRAHAAFDEGSLKVFERLAEQALSGLSDSERMLRARLIGERAILRCEREIDDGCIQDLMGTLESDPGFFRRVGFAIPVRIEQRGGGGELASMLRRSPRFKASRRGLVLRVDGDREACLLDPLAQHALCGSGDDAAEAARALHEEAFAPRVDLSRVDLDGLDGSTRTGRNPLAPLLDPDL